MPSVMIQEFSMYVIIKKRFEGGFLGSWVIQDVNVRGFKTRGCFWKKKEMPQVPWVMEFSNKMNMAHREIMQQVVALSIKNGR